MALKIDRWLESHITVLGVEKYLYQQIIKQCKYHDYCIFKKLFIKILNLKGKKHLSKSKNENMSAKFYPKTA